MRQALPNACFLGFTGTPIDKQDRSTLRTFGPYIDTYTIEQAVQDRATVPIFYESRLPDLQIIGKTLDQVFEHVFADRTDDERAAIKQRFATEQAIAGAPRRIETICLDLIDHFAKFIAPNRFKAQVVATSRDAAVTCKETLDRLNGPESAVVMSAGHNDEERLAKWHLPRHEQERVIDRFKDRNDPLSIIEQRRQERLDAAEQLKLLNDLREDLKGEQSRAEGMELDARGFAIYGLLEKQRPRRVKDRTATYDAANRDLASLIDEAVTPFTDLVDWQQKDDVQRQMRSQIKRRLRAGGIEHDAVESLAADIVDLAKVRTDR